MFTRIQVRRGTTAQWTAANPVLAAGEWGASVDDDEITSLRMGNGVDHWTDLPVRTVTVHWSTVPPQPSDGNVGDLWARIEETP